MEHQGVERRGPQSARVRHLRGVGSQARDRDPDEGEGDTWNCITNVERRLGVSMVGCLAVWGSVFRAVRAFAVSPAPKAAYVLAPSLAWISVACVLTASIWNLNGRPPVYPAAGDGDSADLRIKYLLQMEATSIRGGK